MLEKIKSPEDMRGLSGEEREALASEIRRGLIDTVPRTGGHLASNLGAVELTLALHTAFHAPQDKLVFDVGHQSYAHKMLTGRAERMHTLRQKNGLSGFPRIRESEYDTNCAGHASDAISIALGLARARDLRGENHHVVAVVGDGAMTGGMCYEALNDAGQSRTRLIVILNDNEMSISPNVGALAAHLTKMRQSNFYRSFKQSMRAFLGRMPRFGAKLQKALVHVRDALKSLLISDMFFDALDIEYLGPIDGHDMPSMIRVFERAKNYDEPVLIHVVTKKGRGYALAETHPDLYHGIAPKCESGSGRDGPEKASGVIAAQELCLRAQRDARIACVSAAMLSGTGMDAFCRAYPKRCFDVGIAEAHAVTMAAGLALGGMKPYVAIYSTFLQRAYDQTMMDVCLNGADVTFLIDRAGLNGADGETHQGVFDIGFLRGIPGLAIASPRDGGELRRMLRMSFDAAGPMAIRYAKQLRDTPLAEPFTPGEWACLREGCDACLIAVGRMTDIALDAADRLQGENVRARVVYARYIKPMDEACLARAMELRAPVITLEDGALAGGFGEGVGARLREMGFAGRVISLGVPDAFIAHASVKEQTEMCFMDAESVKSRVLRALERESADAARG